MMKKMELSLQSEQAVAEYLGGNWLTRSEREIINEILTLIKNRDKISLAWFAGFGEDLRHISMNVNEYRKGLEFGFTEITFRSSGWLITPKFLDLEKIKIEASEIRIGHGPNGLWAYALSVGYGCAGHSGPLSAFCKKFSDRDAALTAALAELKKDMLSKVGNTDRTNYHQDLLSKTLKAITKMEIGLVQLTLF